MCNDAFRKWIAYFVGHELHTGDNVLSEKLDKEYLDKFSMCYELALKGKIFNAVEDVKIGDELKFNAISFNPVFDAANCLTGISCHASDITDHRKSLSRLEAQTQLLMEIAAIQSHKVRGPVATLLGLVQVFNFNDFTDPVNAEVMEGVANVTERLDNIVREVIRNVNRFNVKKTRYQ